ncbi:flagellar assembly protein T N-terminal domain-containing protein [Marinobacterium arenosum]|uniref:flagellar assembly protein T N-terminal domain-containing protein n=1 Tax=Marinobacterium arenosum TaxID=2862496 RepID=UPI001C9804F1|nr:flagellar assembly protein T N-terminal domain-containing protein [Marinobacterium arenosum]MBY4675638.1 flagellar assembly protein T N-terminal domain-containing protein [Marinobacterium arenosum]
MLRALLPLFICLFGLLTAQLAQAVSVVAEGRALIFNNDLVAAREAAIQDAAQQAAMQGAVYVSSNQQVRDGILEIDDMRIATLGKVSNIEILDKKVEGRQFIVRIRAEVITDQGCSNGNGNGNGNSYRKSVAVAAFPLQTPAQASLGALHDIESGLAEQLYRRLNDADFLQALNAGHLNLHPDLQIASSRQLSDGVLTTVVANSQNLDVQYIVSGVIRDLSMQNPDTVNEQNFFIDLYNRLDYKSKKHLRVFALDLFIHEGFSGALLWQKRYQTAGLWHYEPERRTGFNTAAFAKTNYGHAVGKLLGEIDRELTDQLRCRPFSARITRTEDKRVWINAGELDGLHVGDRLTVYRRSTAYTANGLQSVSQLSNSRVTVTIEELQPTFAVGRLSADSGSMNIRPDDIVKSW